MSNKTALQELIDYLKQVQGSAITDSFFNGLQSGITKATELLEKQKDQIMDAYNDGWLHGEKKNYFKTGEQYFNQKYKQ